jgi:hypothetical protein
VNMRSMIGGWKGSPEAMFRFCKVILTGCISREIIARIRKSGSGARFKFRPDLAGE